MRWLRLPVNLLLVSATVLSLIVGGTGALSPGSAAPAGQAPVVAEMASLGPGTRMSVRALPHIPQAQDRVVPVLSDLAQGTLDTLKRTPFERPMQVPYKEQRDTTKGPARGSTTQSLQPVVTTQFQGPMQSDNAAHGFLTRPPDPDIAAGPNHIVVVVNSLITIYNKTGTKLSQSTLADWFADLQACIDISGCFPFDPRVAYDPQENRWLVVALHQDDSPNRSLILLSVSTSSDPTGSWNIWALSGIVDTDPGPGTENTWADYPDVGYDGILSTASTSGAVYITANQFTFPSTSGAFRTSAVHVLPKSALYAGTSSSYWIVVNFTNLDSSLAFTLRAAETYGNPGGEYLINTKDPGSIVTLWKIIPTYPPTPSNVTRQANISIGAYGIPPNATQPGCADQLDTIDNRLYNAVWRNNRIYTAFTQAQDWGGGTVAAIRYLKINTATNSAELNTVFGADQVYYYMPAIAVDLQENIFLTFARGNSSEYGSLYYTAHPIGGSIKPSTLLKAGVQCITGSRWGDYFGVAVDPADLLKVWVFGEWASDEASISSVWDWGTWIARARYSLFTDVFPYDFYFSQVEQIYNRGITAGCATNPLRYCPGSNVTRRDMAIFIIRAMGQTPMPSCSGVFSDVPPSDYGCVWIEKLASLGITAGCAPGLYCPNDNVLRRYMAIFILRGMGITTPCPSGCTQVFSDVPPSDPQYSWIHELYNRGITAGCGGGMYCPNNPVTRGEMAVFLIRAFP